MNVSDSERIASMLSSLDYVPASNLEDADLALVNMCSVRQTAVDRVHGLAKKFREIREKNKKFTAILTGCVLKKDSQKLCKIFDYVIDVREIKDLAKFLGSKSFDSIDHYLQIAPAHQSKFSANVPIMTGCNNFCTYCVVPYTRNRETSRPAKEIVAEITKLVKKGYKEIWLLGQNVNSYHGLILSKKGWTSFSELLEMIEEIPGEFWVRFTSSHPKDFNEKVIKTTASCKKVTPYLNLPVQSGDNAILKKMNRRYKVSDYKALIKKARKEIPNLCLSTDIIVGFPGETQKQFENTAKLFREVGYDMAYINKYSPRPGTAAEKLNDNVSKEEKKNREKILTEILKETALENNKKIVGKETVVLIDSKTNDGWLGKNDQYKTVKIKSNGQKKDLVGKFVNVKITKAMEWALEGEIK